MQDEGGKIIVHCRVALYGTAQTRESPAELEISLPDGNEVCRVAFARGYQPQLVEPSGWRVMAYVGTIPEENVGRLLRFVRHTRRRVTVEVGVEPSAPGSSGIQFWPPKIDTRGVPFVGSPTLTAIISDWNRPDTNHLETANNLLSKGMVIANKIVSYGRATDPVSLAPKLVQADFVDEADAWSENVRSFWVRSRDSQ
jgi:hypothetical protein